MPTLAERQAEIAERIKALAPEFTPSRLRLAQRIVTRELEAMDDFVDSIIARLPEVRRLLQEKGWEGQELEDHLDNYIDKALPYFVEEYSRKVEEFLVKKVEKRQARSDAILQGSSLFAPKQETASTAELAKVSEEKTAALKPSSGG